jgi:hypothetical protein
LKAGGAGGIGKNMHNLAMLDIVDNGHYYNCW